MRDVTTRHGVKLLSWALLFANNFFHPQHKKSSTSQQGGSLMGPESDLLRNAI
jgi:hypothetical protein